jgi:hypothetical protein
MLLAMTISISEFASASVTVGTPSTSALMSSTVNVKYLPSVSVKKAHINGHSLINA